MQKQYERVCRACKVRFLSDKKNALYCCDECRRYAKVLSYEKNHPTGIERKLAAKRVARASEARFNRILKLAEEAGMSYGKYVATHPGV